MSRMTDETLDEWEHEGRVAGWDDDDQWFALIAEARRARANEAELVEVLREAEAALEHCRHRPHEHNPPPGFTVTRCEVIDRALAALSRYRGGR